MTNSFTNIVKIARVNKCNKIQGLEREEIKEDPEMSANIAKVTRCFSLIEKDHLGDRSPEKDCC